ncbi:spidroin-2-like [Melospiza melodia melodia]|uniref:spidroin-2-like n=1 Tax=Melospiza melodia melodia TaxID=1914991 RepID=UPI002FD176C0
MRGHAQARAVLVAGSRAQAGGTRSQRAAGGTGCPADGPGLAGGWQALLGTAGSVPGRGGIVRFPLPGGQPGPQPLTPAVAAGTEARWVPQEGAPQEEAPSEPPHFAFHFHAGSPTQGPGRGGGGAEEEPWAAAAFCLAPQEPFGPGVRLSAAAAPAQVGMARWQRAGGVRAQGPGDSSLSLVPCPQQRCRRGVSLDASLLLLLAVGPQPPQPGPVAPRARRTGWLRVWLHMGTVTSVP